MTVPHLMNCQHSVAGWCLECVAELGRENWDLREALRNARIEARARMVTTRKFASEWCKISPTQLSEWTGELPTTPPDFIEYGAG